jgi:hypothetical protein
LFDLFHALFAFVVHLTYLHKHIIDRSKCFQTNNPHPAEPHAMGPVADARRRVLCCTWGCNPLESGERYARIAKIDADILKPRAKPAIALAGASAWESRTRFYAVCRT